MSVSGAFPELDKAELRRTCENEEKPEDFSSSIAGIRDDVPAMDRYGFYFRGESGRRKTVSGLGTNVIKNPSYMFT